MKKLATILSVAAVAWSVNAAAETVDHFSAGDANGDGFFNREEVRGYYKDIFAELDVNGDHALDIYECDYGCVEYKPGQAHNADRFKRQEDISKEVKRQFETLDANHNELVDLDEYQVYFVDQMMQKDANGDDKISRDEYSAE